MNLFNRILLIVLSLALVIAAGAILLITLGLAHPEQLAPPPWLAARLVPFTQLDPTSWWWTVGTTSLLLVLGVLLLIAECRPGPAPPRRLVLKEDPLGRVTIAHDGVRMLVEREAAQVSGVMEVRAQIEPEPQGLAIHCRVAVDPTSSLPELAEQLQQRVKLAVEHQLGRPVARVQVDAQTAPLAAPRGGRRVR
ncbi:MAG TPA: alkaline shock response membrane anchor protein AmaP [Chloroflexota bacterium]|nr:alkaline shock response membrane anchor protein AmaP [Chloroflexota bacterium]